MVIMKTNIRVGDRVWVEGEEDFGTVVEFTFSGVAVRMDSDGVEVDAHPKQVKEISK